MKRYIKICAMLLLGIVIGVGLVACGSSDQAKFEKTYKKFLMAMKNANIKEYYSYTEVAAFNNAEEEKKEYEEWIKDMTNKEFYEDVTDYLQWTSGNDNFSCYNGIDKLEIKEIKADEINDEGYQKNCIINAHVLITTADDEDYDLNIKADFISMRDGEWWINY